MLGMPCRKAILTKTYDGFGGKCNFRYAHLKQYDLGGGIKVRLKKETASFTRYAGWGLQAMTSIPKGFVLGHFVVKSRDADEPEEGTYNIKTRQGRKVPGYGTRVTDESDQYNCVSEAPAQVQLYHRKRVEWSGVCSNNKTSRSG